MLQTYGHDKYICTLADVILPNGMNLNQELCKKPKPVSNLAFRIACKGSQDMQRIQASKSNVLEPVQLRVILNPVVVCSLKAQVRQVWLSKSLAQNVETLSRFSAGISVFSREGQKEMLLEV